MRPPAALLLHVSIAAFWTSVTFGLWPAHGAETALASAARLWPALAVYGLAWALARRRGGSASTALVLSAAGTALAGYFLLQYRYLEVAPKVGVVDAVGRTLSAAMPRLAAWTPFSNSVATALDGLCWLAVGVAAARGAAAVRLAGASCAVVLFAGVAVSASRGSWMASGVAGVVWLIAGFGRPLPPRLTLAAGALATVVLAVVLYAAAAPGTPWWMTLAATIDRPDRLGVYADALTLAREVPFSGVGDQFAAWLSRFALLIQVPYLTYAHSLSLDLWVTAGVVTLAAWWALAAAIVVAAWAGEHAGLGRRFRGAWVGVLAIHVHAVVDARQVVDAWTWLPFFALCGAMAGTLAHRRIVLPGPSTVAVPIGVAAVSVLAVLAGRGDVRAAWHTDLGSQAQARAAFDGPANEPAAESRADARRHFERALAADPDDPHARRRLGLLELDAGRADSAVIHLARSWSVDAENGATRKAYGLAAAWVGDIDRAASLLRPVAGIVAELNTWSTYHEGRGALPLAIAAAQVSLRLEPRQVDVARRVSELARRRPPS